MRTPKNWTEAHNWQDEMNAERADCGYSVPLWNFDCNFKLDFDGPLIQLSCRFYPPTAAYGEDGWNGSIELYMGELVIWKKSVKASDLDELKAIVEEEAERLSKKIRLGITSRRK